MKPTRTNGGFTAVEAVISVLLLSLILGGLFMAIDRGMGLFRQSTANQEADGRLERAIDRISREVFGASRASLGPDLTTLPGDPVAWSEQLDFRPATGWDGTTVTLGALQRIQLRIAQGEVDNGIDDDGDGLADEHEVVLVRDLGLGSELTVVLVRDVAELLEGETQNGLDDNGNGLEDERGMVFDVDGDTLNLRLTVTRAGPQGPILRTRVASVALRNN